MKAPDLQFMAPNYARPEHIKAVVDRAEAMIQRARLVNAAQYAHGINSTTASIEYCLRRIAAGKAGTYAFLDDLNSKVMKLGGYLYALKEGL